MIGGGRGKLVTERFLNSDERVYKQKTTRKHRMKILNWRAVEGLLHKLEVR